MTKNNLKKIDIAKCLSKKEGFSVQFSKKLINDLLYIFTQNIKANHFKIKNIGSFKLINKKQRVGRNPKTKEVAYITSRRSLSFLPSRKILEKINK